MQNVVPTKIIFILYSALIFASCSLLQATTEQTKKPQIYKNEVGKIEKTRFNQQLPMTLFIYAKNAAQDVQTNLDSILEQEYQNYRIIYFDDASTDATLENVSNYVSSHRVTEKIQVISPKSAQGELCAMYSTLHQLTDNEIIVLLNGHDKVINKWVLGTINNEYSQQDTWLTYGASTSDPKGCNIGLRNPPIPDEIIQKKEYRKVFSFSPLRTFYAWLFKKIHKNDLIDPKTGSFYAHAAECYVMWPLVEMAHSHVKAFTEFTYVINCNDQVAKLTQDYYIRRACNSQMGNKMPQYAEITQLS